MRKNSKFGKKRDKKFINIGTWNIHLGIHDMNKITNILQFIKSRKVDILSIQESGAREDIYSQLEGYKLIFPKSTAQEGLEFNTLDHFETLRKLATNKKQWTNNIQKKIQYKLTTSYIKKLTTQHQNRKSKLFHAIHV